MKRIVKDIIESLEQEPTSWTVDGYTWARRDGLEVWRSNVPILNLHIYGPYEMGLTLWEKIRLYWAFRKWRNSISLDHYMRRGGA